MLPILVIEVSNCSSTSGQVLSSAMIVTVFTSAACHSDSGEDNGTYLQPTLSVDFHPIYVSTNKLLSQPVIYSIVLDTVPSQSCVARPYFTQGHYHLQYNHLML